MLPRIAAAQIFFLRRSADQRTHRNNCPSHTAFLLGLVAAFVAELTMVLEFFPLLMLPPLVVPLCEVKPFAALVVTL